MVCQRTLKTKRGLNSRQKTSFIALVNIHCQLSCSQKISTESANGHQNAILINYYIHLNCCIRLFRAAASSLGSHTTLYKLVCNSLNSRSAFVYDQQSLFVAELYNKIRKLGHMYNIYIEVFFNIFSVKMFNNTKYHCI